MPGNWQPWKRLLFNDVGSILFGRRRAMVMVLFRRGDIMTLKVINIQGEVLKELPKNAG